jgi:L-amino acid N-acyltransferase YncA
LLRKSPELVYTLYSAFRNLLKNKIDMTDILQPMHSSDTEAILKIYSQVIAGGQSTIVTRVLACEKWNSAHIPSCHMAGLWRDIVLMKRRSKRVGD